MFNNKLTSDRCVPGIALQRVVEDHFARYQFACTFIKKKMVLDIACGVGYGTAMMVKAGAKHVTGVDISKIAINYARKKYLSANSTFMVGNALSFKSANKFDVIVSYETIEHVDKDIAMLCNIHKLLKKTGVLIISTPNRIITSPGVKSLINKPLNPTHVREYTLEEFIHLLKKAGFVVNNDEVFGQRLRPYFNSRILDSIINIIFQPNTKFSPDVKKIGIMTPRYIVIIASKQKS